MPSPPSRSDSPLLSSAELEESRAQFEAELRDEHNARVAKVLRRQERSDHVHSVHNQEARQKALNDLRAEVQAEFYKKNGYKIYTDSTGREHWLTPEEFAFRTERRKRRRHRVIEPVVIGRYRQWLFGAGIVGLALLLGMLLAR